MDRMEIVIKRLNEIRGILKKIEANQAANGKNRVIILKVNEMGDLRQEELLELVEYIEEALNDEPAIHRGS